MTFEIAFLFGLLVVMAFFFFTERLPIEITAFGGLVVLVLAGFVPAGEAFAGFASPAVITMLSIFFLSAALLHTGVADAVGDRVHALLGSRERLLVVAIMAVAGLLSSVMNNIAATAVMLPAVASISRRTGISPSRLFMPLSFGAILGGTTTLVGTPPNILAGEMLRERGLEPFGLFDFTPVGGTILLLGIAYMALGGARLLPSRGIPSPVSRGTDLVQVYQLNEGLFTLRVPAGSRLDGRSIRETALGSTLGLQVIGVVRGGKRRLAPDPDTVLLAGDALLVEGRGGDLRELFRLRGSAFVEAVPEELIGSSERVGGVVARLAEDSPLAGRTLGELRFRERFGAVAIGIRRGGRLVETRIAREPLRAGDEVLALGSRSQLEEIELQSHFEVRPLGPEILSALQGHLYVLSVPKGSGLVDATVGGSRLGELLGLTILGVLRGGEALLGLGPDERILAGDRLLVTGTAERIRALLDLGDVQLLQDVSGEAFESEDVGIVEATIAPRSACAGRTLEEIRFREKHGLQVLAVWREGELVHTGLANLALRFGDALLVQGPWEKIRLLAGDRDFLVLSERVRERRRTPKAPVALGALVLMVGFVVSGFQPIHVAAFTAATLVVLGRAVTMEEAYRAVEWRAVFLVAAILPVGVAMESTGAAALLSVAVTEMAGPAGPYAVLAGLALLASLLSQALDGAPAVVLLTPVALTTAESLGISPRPVMMAISLAASAAFMTPFSHKANLLVMGAGGYRVADYLKAGTPLTVVLLALIVVLVPVFFPF